MGDLVTSVNRPTVKDAVQNVRTTAFTILQYLRADL